MLARGQPPSTGGAARARPLPCFAADLRRVTCGAIGEASRLERRGDDGARQHVLTRVVIDSWFYCLTYWKFSIFAVSFLAGALTIVVAA